MDPLVEECKALISDILPIVFGQGDYNWLVEDEPGKVLDGYSYGVPVALWGQSLTGATIYVNMMNPELRRFLKRFASRGIRGAEAYENVRYRFVSSKFSPSGIRQMSMWFLTLV